MVKRIAVIGCGAIAEAFHIPALAQLGPQHVDVVLVDPDPERAAAAGRPYDIQKFARSHEEVVGNVDAAIIASPHHTHVPIALDLVSEGVAVLSEKPLGVSVAEVETLDRLSTERGVTVAVNQTRRFIPACQELKRIVDSGELGREIAVEAREGDRFDWPLATPSMFGARSGGKGVLLDIGAHVLDLFVWWFGPDLELTDYRDDSFGGSEAAVLLELRNERARIQVRLSWLARQANRYDFAGARGRLTWGVYDLDELQRSQSDGSGARKQRVATPVRSFADLGPVVIRDFLEAAAQGSPATAGPKDVLPSMRLMEACYERRTHFDMPWHAFSMEFDR